MVSGAVLSWSASASAHIELTSPPARYGPDYQKSAPCGPDPASPPMASGAVTVYQAGETITLSIDEYVGHTGSLRVAIDPTGTDAFQFPTGYDDLEGPNILGAFDDPPGGGVVDIQVTLPDENCDPCTLQVIQIMEDGSFSPDDFYFQCADIVIEGGVAATGGADTGGGDTGDGSASAGTITAGNDEGDSGAGDAGDSTGGGGGVDGGPAEGDGDGADDASADDGTGGAATGGTGDDAGAGEEDAGGCGCRGAAPRSTTAWMLGLLGLVLLRRRR